MNASSYRLAAGANRPEFMGRVTSAIKDKRPIKQQVIDTLITVFYAALFLKCFCDIDKKNVFIKFIQGDIRVTFSVLIGDT